MTDGPILFVPYRSIGDFVRSQSLIRACNAVWPNRPIDIVTDPPSAEVAAFMPEIRHAFAFAARHNRLDMRRRWALARRLREKRYSDAVVMRHGVKAALLPFMADIPNRIGAGRMPRFPLINRRVSTPGDRDYDQMTEFARRVFELGDRPLPPPHMVVGAEAPPGRQDRGVVVALLPGDPSDERRWPIDSAANLIDLCHGRGWRVALIGGPQDRAVGDRLATRFPDVENRTGGSLHENIVRLAAVTAVVAKDGGLLHIAAALGLPTVGLFGMTDPWPFAPANPQVRIMTPDGAVRSFDELRPNPSFLPTPIDGIGADAVFAELSEAVRATA